MKIDINGVNRHPVSEVKKMPLGGAKDEHFTCFHSSCQLGLIKNHPNFVQPKLILHYQIHACNKRGKFIFHVGGFRHKGIKSLGRDWSGFFLLDKDKKMLP